MVNPTVHDSYLLEEVVDPNSNEFRRLMELLLSNPAEVEHNAGDLLAKGEFRFTLPFRGEPEDESEVVEFLPLQFPERGVYRNGATSLALVYAELLDMISVASGRKKTALTLCVTAECIGLVETLASAGSASPLVQYVSPNEFVSHAVTACPETLIVDHTSFNAPIDDVLNFAYRMGVTVVDGVFPYHIAAVKGWDITAGFGKWSYTHSGDFVTIGPDDDTSRMIKYRKKDYLKFVQPSTWSGNARKYGYELRKSALGLVTYRAVYLGDDVQNNPKEKELIFSLPACSSHEMVMITINRDLAAGVFVSQSNNAQDLARLERDYAIEVRRELFVTCVNFLIAKKKNTDIVTDAVRYITEHNYVDLVDGIRIVRAPSLSYADALCVAMVCSLTAFSLRYRLTNDTLADIKRHAQTAKALADPAFGALGRLAWYMGTYVSDAVELVAKRSIDAAKRILNSSDYIPGVCYEVCMSERYTPELDWFEPVGMVTEAVRDEYENYEKKYADFDTDPVTEFIAEASKTAAPTLVKQGMKDFKVPPLEDEPYVATPSDDPVAVLQDQYDTLFPGNSTAKVQNAAELRKVRDIEFHTEFQGKIEINKDIPVNEELHESAPLRTTALPQSRTTLVDAILASAKRNFNPPDLQLQNDPWAYARYLADKFEEFAFVPGFKRRISPMYKRDPLSFNLQDYLEWRATRSEAYKRALLGDCPEELMVLGLDKFDTIVKKRIKPKLSITAQHELAQPQVIISMSKSDTAPFTSVFRKLFERFEGVLKPGIASAGRMSDDDVTEWFTANRGVLEALKVVELDSSKYDKSQGLLARMVEALISEDLGMEPGLGKLYEDSYVGKVSSMVLGLMFMSAYQMKSGFPDTMYGNVIYNGVSSMESIGPENIAAAIYKGDDNLTWLKRVVDYVAVAGRMGALFNLDAKLIADEPPYFSSAYVVPTESRLWYVPDPVKLLEMLGERGLSPSTVKERYVSFRDRVATYRKSADLMVPLTVAVRRRMRSPEFSVKLVIDNLIAVADSFELFEQLVG